MAKLIIGWAEESITPDKRVSLVGQFYERISEYVETPLTATALAIEAGDDQCVMVSGDLTSASHNVLVEIREKLLNEGNLNGLDVNKIIFGATHTHTSISYTGRGDRGNFNAFMHYLPEGVKYEAVVDASTTEGVQTPDEGRAMLVEKVAKVIRDAWAARRPGYIATGFGRATVGMNRRVCYDDGSAKMWGDTNNACFTTMEAGADSGIEMLFTYDENKKITGALLNVACPSQVLEHRSFVSSDYWGKVKKYLRERLGEDFFVYGMCSAAGDQCPRDLIRWVEPHVPILDPNIERLNVLPRTADPSMFEIEGTVKIGKRIGREVMDAIEDVTELVDDCAFEHRPIKMDLPFRRVTMGEAKAAEESFKRYIAGKTTVNYADKANTLFECGILGRYQQQQTNELINIEVHVLRVGNVAFATNPFELFIDFGNLIRARSKANQTFLSQLTCGSYGYLPTEHAENGGHYSAFVGSGTVGHVGGDMYVRRVLTEINDMFEE